MSLTLRAILPATVSMAMGLLFVACHDDKSQPDPAVTRSRADIVTYLNTETDSQNGQIVAFEYIGRNDSAPVTLLAHNLSTTGQLTPHQRVLLYYDWADNNTLSPQRNINAFAVSAITFDSLRISSLPMSHFAHHAIRLRSIWRTADYINLRCEVEYTGLRRHFYLLLDSITRSCDTVHTYLVHNTWADTLRHWRTAIASFNVGAVWNRPSCRVLRVHIADTLRSDVEFYDFEKTTIPTGD